jgi:multidrug resistance efflux pump
MKKSTLTALIGVIGCSLVAFSYARGNCRKAAASEAPCESTGRWASVHGIGYVEPANEVRRISFKASGVIAQISVSPGDRVSKGQPLMVFENRAEQAAVAVAEQELMLARAERDQTLSGSNEFQIAAAQSEVDLLREQLRQLKDDQQRVHDLYKRKAASGSANEQAESSVVQKAAALENAENHLKYLKHRVTSEDRRVAEAKASLAEARLEMMKRRLEDTTLVAPSNGTVLELLKREGEGIRPTEAEPVAMFADCSKLRIRAEFDERFVGKLHEGQTAVISGRGLGGHSYKGSITFLKPIMGKKGLFSRSATERKDLDVIEAFIEFNGSEISAPIGLQVDVEIQIDE